MKFCQEPNRIYLPDEAGNTIAEVTFHETESGAMAIDHTYVSNALRGQGVAGELLRAVADRFRREGTKAVPVCSYAVKWFEEHPGERELLK